MNTTRRVLAAAKQSCINGQFMQARVQLMALSRQELIDVLVNSIKVVIKLEEKGQI